MALARTLDQTLLISQGPSVALYNGKSLSEHTEDGHHCQPSLRVSQVLEGLNKRHQILKTHPRGYLLFLSPTLQLRKLRVRCLFRNWPKTVQLPSAGVGIQTQSRRIPEAEIFDSPAVATWMASLFSRTMAQPPFRCPQQSESGLRCRPPLLGQEGFPPEGLLSIGAGVGARVP